MFGLRMVAKIGFPFFNIKTTCLDTFIYNDMDVDPDFKAVGLCSLSAIEG